jgi:ribosomal protein S18 acetylase RimI-like enzyme
MSFTVRLADAKDVDALAALESEARAGIETARGGAAALAEQQAVGDWSEVLASVTRRVWIAEIDGVPLGYLDLELPAGDGANAVIRQVWVHPDSREVGFGDDLVGEAIAAASEHGATSIESWALPGDRDTKNLFERAGLTARKLIVAKRLSDPSSSGDASR